jgi:hypothetical protein
MLIPLGKLPQASEAVLKHHLQAHRRWQKWVIEAAKKIINMFEAL